MVIVPVNVRIASANDVSIESVWVATSSRWRFQRSTKMPANGVNRNAGNCEANPTTPRSNADPVIR